MNPEIPARVRSANTDLRDLSADETVALVKASGHPAFRANQLLEWLYVRRVWSFDTMRNLPRVLRDRLEDGWTLNRPDCVRVLGSADTTRKFLFRIGGGDLIETVLIPASVGFDGKHSRRMTLCVSSQVGCAYGCRFCASGLDGWKRNLAPHEIVGQVLEVEHLAGCRVGNLVFMGMGEPMANYDNLIRAVTILNAPWGCQIGARHITISTSGLVPRILDLAGQPLQTRLAISLHGATDEVRDRIMPVNKRHPLGELLDACAQYTTRKKQKITFEFILIAGVNDDVAQARALAAHAARLGAKVNLIPYNRVEGLDWERPSPTRQETFLKILVAAGITATLRREKGHDIAAACGQLRRQTQGGSSSPYPDAAG